jgi:hypothetical protein
MAIESAVELFILDSSVTDSVVVYARCDSDIAVARVRLDARWDALLKFRNSLDSGLRGNASRPASKDVDRFGNELFAFLMQGEVGRLYAAVQHDRARQQMSVTIFSDRPEVQDIPWEYLQEPGSSGGPGERAVVRLLSTIGLGAPAPVKAAAGVRILLVSADPVMQTGVSWPDIQASLERIFQAKVTNPLDLTIVEGASLATISKALRGPKSYDVFHFSGHGEVRNGEGGLILTGPGADAFLPADKLAALFRGSGVRLAVLSACDTSTGNRKDSFAVVADALIRVGIPAVVANQLPVPNSTVATFVGALYDELLISGNIDRAVTRGRRALAYELNRVGGDAGIEWGIPTLHRLLGASLVYTP